ncbi:MAG: hypothetical protein KF819_18965 [Labilithrix sp.]|nr:hypothetical protein [Labilithrix sp.]
MARFSMGGSDGNPDDSHAHGPPPPPEPKTPMWLPALGAVLFLTVGLVWALSEPSKDATDSGAPGAASAAADAGAKPSAH